MSKNSIALNPQILKIGLNEIVNNRGMAFEIAEVGISPEGFIPNADMILLPGEVARTKISGGIDKGSSVEVSASFSGPLETWVRSVCFYNEKGVPIAIYSNGTGALTNKQAGEYLLLSYSIDFSVLPANSVKIVVGAPNFSLFRESYFIEMRNKLEKLLLQKIEALKNKMLLLHSDMDKPIYHYVNTDVPDGGDGTENKPYNKLTDALKDFVNYRRNIIVLRAHQVYEVPWEGYNIIKLYGGSLEFRKVWQGPHPVIKLYHGKGSLNKVFSPIILESNNTEFDLQNIKIEYINPKNTSSSSYGHPDTSFIHARGIQFNLKLLIFYFRADKKQSLVSFRDVWCGATIVSLYRCNLSGGCNLFQTTKNTAVILSLYANKIAANTYILSNASIGKTNILCSSKSNKVARKES